MRSRWTSRAKSSRLSCDSGVFLGHPPTPSIHITVADIFAYLDAWFARDPRTDINMDGAANIQDIFDFLATWFAGC